MITTETHSTAKFMTAQHALLAESKLTDTVSTAKWKMWQVHKRSLEFSPPPNEKLCIKKLHVFF